MTKELRWLSLGACVAFAAACRPAVEEEILCASTGDLACPSGFHCGAAGRCVPGEVAPALAFSAPDDGATLSAQAPTDVLLRASSPLGLGALKLELVATGPEGARVEVPTTVEYVGTDKLAATYKASLEGWTFDDGDYALVATLPALAGGAPAVATRPVKVAVGGPVVQFTAPQANAQLTTDTDVVFTAATPRGVDTVTLSLNRVGEEHPIAVTPTWGDEAHRSGTFRGTLPALVLQNTSYTLEAIVTARSGNDATTRISRDVVVAVPGPTVTILSAKRFTGDGVLEARVASPRGVKVDALLLRSGAEEVTLEFSENPSGAATAVTLTAPLEVNSVPDGVWTIRALATFGFGSTLGAEWVESFESISMDVPDPTVEFVAPGPGAVLSGRVAVEARVVSRREVTEPVLNVDGPGEDDETRLDAELEPTGNPHEYLLSGTFDSWLLPAGASELRASVETGSDGEVRATRAVTIQPRAASLLWTAPAAGAWLKGPQDLEVQVEGDAPVNGVVLTALGRSGGADVVLPAPAFTWSDATHTKATAKVAFDSTPFADGELTVKAAVALASGASAQATRTFQLANGALTVTRRVATTSSHTVAGSLLVEFNRPLAGAPTLTGTGWNIVPTTGGYAWSILPGASITGDTNTLHLHAADLAGNVLDRDESVATDFQAPGVVGDVEVRRPLLGTATVTFRCSEPATWQVGTLRGPCDTSATVVNLTSSGVPSVRVFDALENTSETRATKETDEVETALSSLTLRRAGGQPFLGATSSLGTTKDAQLTTADGQGKSAQAITTDTGAPVGLRVGAPKRTNARPIVFDEDATLVRFGLMDGDVLSTHEIGADGAVRTLAAIRTSGKVRPAWDPTNRAWIYRDPVDANVLVQATYQRVLRRVTLTLPTTILETLVCGNTWYGLVGGALPARVVAVNLVSGTTLDELGPVPGGASETARLVCRNDVPLIFASANGNLHVHRRDNGVWTSIASTADRSAFMVSSKGHVAGGTRSSMVGGFPTTEYLADILQYNGTSFVTVQASGGPRRRDGTLVARTPMLVLGGTGSTATSLVATAANGFAEAAVAANPGYANAYVTTYDFDRQEIFVLSMPSGPANAWTWRNGTWLSTPVSGYSGGTPGYAAYVPAPVARVVFGGGMTMMVPPNPTGTTISSSYTWDGTQIASSTPVPVASDVPAPLSDGRLALLGQLHLRGTNGSWSAFTSSFSALSPSRALTRVGDPVVRLFGIEGSTRYYVEAAFNGTSLTHSLKVPTSDSIYWAHALPWRFSLLQTPDIGDRIWKLTPLSGGATLYPALPELTDAGYLAPLPARKLMVVRSAEDPPLVEVNDEVLPGALVALAAPYTYRVQICARTMESSNSTPDVTVELVTDEGVEPVTATPTVVSGPSTPCQRRAFDVTATTARSLLVTASKAAISATTQVVLDEVVVTRTFAP